MGAKIEEKEDGFVVEGSSLKGDVVSSCSDHRIAMALAVAGLSSDGKTVVRDVKCVEKSYPTFLKDMKAIKGDIYEHSFDRV